MDRHVEQLEEIMGEVSGQGELLRRLSEVVNKLTERVEQIAIQTNELAGNSSARLHISSKGKGDPTIWLYKTKQFFQLHGIPVQDRVALASFHMDSDAHLWYQLLQQEVGIVTWEEFRDGLNSRRPSETHSN
ncbi:hypothetical protein Pint_32851 [Pistacia integerrima]|uniref:Uncharacterized protein n=1 Tax=Pistacia integerrima TaxID=434235 RepID=A0ACC0X3V5_9ROSI|nr:hypothetical protein Pint_32851 [Pistacia integerrima]